MHFVAVTADSIKRTKNSANGITVLVNFIQPPFNIVERLDTRDIVDDYHSVCASIVATAGHQ